MLSISYCDEKDTFSKSLFDTLSNFIIIIGWSMLSLYGCPKVITFKQALLFLNLISIKKNIILVFIDICGIASCRIE
jgi:hypothetical protein